MIKEITIARIPFPEIILKGDWSGAVYAITTYFRTAEAHQEAVEKAIKAIKNGFNDEHHHTVSLRVVKQEDVCPEGYLSQCTLVEFRIRDSY